MTTDLIRAVEALLHYYDNDGSFDGYEGDWHIMIDKDLRTALAAAKSEPAAEPAEDDETPYEQVLGALGFHPDAVLDSVLMHIDTLRALAAAKSAPAPPVQFVDGVIRPVPWDGSEPEPSDSQRLGFCNAPGCYKVMGHEGRHTLDPEPSEPEPAAEPAEDDEIEAWLHGHNTFLVAPDVSLYLYRWLRQSIYDAPSSDNRKRLLDEYAQGLIADLEALRAENEKLKADLAEAVALLVHAEPSDLCDLTNSQRRQWGESRDRLARRVALLLAQRAEQ